MNQLDFDRLVKQLSGNQRCVLVLGPEFINIDSGELDFTVSIQDHLSKVRFSEMTKDYYFGDDGFLLYDDLDKKFDILNKIKDYYGGLPVTESYKKLARIPFTSIISLSPDDLMIKAYNDIKKDFTRGKYNGDLGFEDGPIETTKERPMIYNLMGHYEHSEDLVFTFENLFKFLDRLFQDAGKDNLRAHIKGAARFLFLGFNYDKWYLKLIFYLFRKFRGFDTEFQRHAIFNYNENFGQKIKYYESTASFGLKFSQERERTFIDDLFNACQEKGLLSDVRSIQEVDIGALKKVSKEKYKILYLAASPEGKLILNSAEKFIDIKNLLKSDFYELLDSGDKEKPDLKFTRNAIPAKVNADFPNLIYFNCHGTPDGELILSKENNKPDYFPLEELKEMIGLLSVEHKQINCIVFSACKSEKQAKEISKIINAYCIGMSKTVDQDVSDLFTKGFFQGFIRDKQNFEYAFRNGVSEIKNSTKDEYKAMYTIPVLYKNGERYENGIE